MNARQRADKDYWEFQFNQLDDANFQTGEQILLEQELDQLTHVEDIKTVLTHASHVLYENEQPMVQELYHLVEALRKIVSYLPNGEELGPLILNSKILLKK
jgi:DNA repair protein RecN (Recombination protein N)